ncbi:S-formylglutathione hydrolase [Chlorogloea sp. CCALA 695]|uniref:S-formylglutathione hydrolase n=1 Tax=Chlorogloea sp. CCALA 695 TaxID=2107693 RepID=UPI000D05AE14|nr:S-formylglutathione hydrolase [Chlorogloea sp. CCALA 695]PSB29692.1 S-formylglutathione hydrolase [Chlorogloea sp. CCALA 695]
MSASINLLSENRCFDGTVGFYNHQSQTCNSEMRFSIYQPPQASSQSVPVLYFLSGLTCTEENFTFKAGAQRFAAQYGLMLVVPDTSPRNTGIECENEDWDFGSGASFYVDATLAPWKANYQMYSYIVKELPAIITDNFPVRADKQGIFGHSMGGHGALVCALRNQELYKSVSALAPIVAPLRSPWVDKAFTKYLGTNREAWKEYDATELVLTSNYQRPILIDQGAADKYLDQLQPHLFEEACKAVKQPLTLRFHPGYDHSYYFIATFIEDHICHHAAILCD